VAVAASAVRVPHPRMKETRDVADA
jgi:hypothetical protein